MKNIILLAALLTSSALIAGHLETDKLITQAKKEAGEMKPSVLKAMLDKEEEVIILDVRESEQRAEGDIYADYMYAITRGNLEFKVGNKIKNKNAIIVTYFRRGGR